MMRTPKTGPAPLVLGFALLLSSGTVLAEESTRAASGVETERWLELQKSQKPAANESISGERAALIQRRYLKSFARDIPDELRSETPSSN